jgi:hypothetical protein
VSSQLLALAPGLREQKKERLVLPLFLIWRSAATGSSIRLNISTIRLGSLEATPPTTHPR